MGGRKLSNLGKVNRLVYFGISPFEQKAFKGVNLTEGLPNVLRRIRHQMFMVGIPLSVCFGTLAWGLKETNRQGRKNYADYVDDK